MQCLIFYKYCQSASIILVNHPRVKKVAYKCNFLGNRATEEGGGALGEEEPLEEHPGCVWPILTSLVLTVLESAAT